MFSWPLIRITVVYAVNWRESTKISLDESHLASHRHKKQIGTGSPLAPFHLCTRQHSHMTFTHTSVRFVLFSRRYFTCHGRSHCADASCYHGDAAFDQSDTSCWDTGHSCLGQLKTFGSYPCDTPERCTDNVSCHAKQAATHSPHDATFWPGMVFVRLCRAPPGETLAIREWLPNYTSLSLSILVKILKLGMSENIVRY